MGGVSKEPSMQAVGRGSHREVGLSRQGRGSPEAGLG